MENLSYAVRLLDARVMRQPKHCPYCGNARTERLARKKLPAELRRCPECRLRFRYPRDSAEHNARYYRSADLDWTADKNAAFAQTDNPDPRRVLPGEELAGDGLAGDELMVIARPV